MPTIVKLPPEEVKVIEAKGKSQRQLIAEQYDALLADFAVGDWGDVALDPDEARPAVRRWLTAAAARRGFALRFARGGATMMRFQVVAPGEVPAEEAAGDTEELGDATAEAAPLIVEPEPEAAPPVAEPEPPRRRGGRKKKEEVSPSLEPAEAAAPARRGGRRRTATDGAAGA